MLVLRRQVEEAIEIGKDIKIRILGIEGENVKIGIEAPRDVLVYRTEVKKMLEESCSVQQQAGRRA
ncbi:MAG: carbon storage regulator [Bacillota bacterium]